VASGRLSSSFALEIELAGEGARESRWNVFWGSRIYDELLKLGFSVARSTTYMVKRRGPPNQGWKNFLRNHTPGSWSRPLGSSLVIVRLDRRDLVWINATANRSGIARRITEAFPWDEAPATC
jgi:hypothetical protein